MPNPMKNLIAVIKKRSLEFGDFKLASGKKSNFYLDLRKLSLSEDVCYIAEAISYILRDKFIEFDAIGGPCIGADPIIGAFFYARGLKRQQLWGSFANLSIMTRPKEIRGLLVRK